MSAVRTGGRRAEKLAARSAAAARNDGTQLGWPGAANRFALFAEVLYTGLVVVVVALPLVTLPLALAVGVRHLRRFLLAESSTIADVWADVRAGFVRTLGFGAALLLALALLAGDLLLVSSGVLPGGVAVGVVCGVLLAGVLALVLTSAASWTPQNASWWALLRPTLLRMRDDVRGSLWLVVAVALVSVVTWQLAILVIPALGCLAFAAIAVRARADAR